MPTPTVDQDAYMSVENGRIRCWTKDTWAHLLRDVPAAIWRENRTNGHYWELPATATAAGAVGDALSGLSVECDQRFFDLYNRSEFMEAARVLRDRDDLQEHSRRHPSWMHQRRAFQMGLQMEGFGLWADMGTGKSKVVVDLIDARRHRLVLIVGPKKAIRVWPRQFREYSQNPDIRVVTLGGKGDRRTIPKRAEALLEATRDATPERPVVIVTNYQAFNTVRHNPGYRSEEETPGVTPYLPNPFVSAVMSTDWDLVVADEAHNIKGPNTIISNIFARFPSFVPHRIGLSGTPESKGPLDAWGVYRFLDPGVFGMSYGRFRGRYAIMDPMYPSRVRMYHDLEDFSRRMYSIAFRVTADVLDLPECQDIVVPVQLGIEAMRQHEAMKSDLIAHTEDGAAVADNVLTKLLRMQQITGGHLTVEGEDEERVISRIDFEKLDALQEILETAPNRPQVSPLLDPRPEPVVVFCRFLAELDDVAGLTQSLGRRYREISGRRDDALDEDGRMVEDVDVCGVQIDSGGTGIDLTRAHYGVYFSKGYNLVSYEQSRKRLDRPGQTRPVILYHLVAQGTVDTLVERAMTEKLNVIEFCWQEAIAS